jgi:predicted transcriptional regulator
MSELEINSSPIIPKIGSLLSIFQGFDENRDYWVGKNLCTLPPQLLDRIGELGNCKEFIPEKTHIFDYPPEIMDPLCRSKAVMEISSFCRPGYPNLYLDLAKRGIKVSLVLEKPIYKKMISYYREDIEEFLNMKNTQLFACDHKIELASCIVTDQFISLSIISKDGKYYNHEMLSFEKKALSWGQELFNYYKNTSEPITQI